MKGSSALLQLSYNDNWTLYAVPNIPTKFIYWERELRQSHTCHLVIFLSAILEKKLFLLIRLNNINNHFVFSGRNLRQKKNSLVSGNAGDEKNLHVGGQKKKFYQFNWIFEINFKFKELL